MQQVKDFIIKNKSYIIYAVIAIAVAYFTVKQKIFQVKAAVDINVQLDSATVSDIDSVYLPEDTTIQKDSL